MKSIVRTLLLSALSFSAWAETSLWKVTHGEQQLFIGGTIHVLSSADLPFPTAFDQAYSAAEMVVLETNMEKLLDPQTQIMLMSQLSYQDGRLLNQVISAELYEDLNQYLRERGMVANLFIGMKPAGVMMTMLAVELQRLGISEHGADQAYYQRAKKDGKKITSLEPIEHHIQYVAELGEGNEERFLRQTLDDVEKTEMMMKDMVRNWKQGDVSGLERNVIEDIQQNYPEVYQSLLVDRNRRWQPQIQQMLDTSEVELILVGAAHLIGPDGILRWLENQGYSVEQL